MCRPFRDGPSISGRGGWIRWREEWSEKEMPTYVQLINFSEQGLENIDESPQRVEEAKELIESLGGEFKAFYYLLGQYDAIGIAEFPDDETYMQFALAVNQQGNGTTESLKAFSLAEFDEVVENLPG